MTVLVETAEYTIETLGMTPERRVCPECGVNPIFRTSVRCKHCQGRYMARKRVVE